MTDRILEKVSVPDLQQLYDLGFLTHRRRHAFCTFLVLQTILSLFLYLYIPIGYKQNIWYEIKYSAYIILY